MVPFGFAVIVLLEIKDIKEINKLSSMKEMVKDLNIEMLTLRKHEKDFLARKDKKYLKKFENTINEIDITTKKLKVMLLDFDLDTKDSDSYSKIIHEYSTVFKEIVSTQEKIGLHPKDGLYGSLRSTVHQVQKYAKQANDKNLLSIVYDLRKQEKDFMLRSDKKYLISFNLKLDKLEADSHYQSMSGLLKKYRANFNELVQFEEKKGLNSKLGLMGKMRKTIHKSEISLKSMTSVLNLAVTQKVSNIQTFATIISIAIAIFIVIALLYISNNITTSLRKFEKGLIGFFSFINNEIKEINYLEDKNNDEIGNMSKLINKNITKSKSLMEQDQALINDVKRVVEKIKEGYLNYKVEKSTTNENLQELKVIFNEMLENVESNVDGDINKITALIDSYSKLNFTCTINNPSGKVSRGLNDLSIIINKLLLDSLKNGTTLEENARQLSQNVSSLSTSSNEQAASIEETAAALEEITSTIINTTDNISKMAEYSDELKESILSGQKLAGSTVESMNEINAQTQSIADAITVIDQIAFQTNILSLNAAVEAATAGEAGKGFAVVAQEVRNLASRSADAAKEIKDLVETATVKTNLGKQSADKMIKGYDELNQIIQKTAETISDISASSKEQQTGIEQINDAIATLDQGTQQNAAVATETASVAKSTSAMAKAIVNQANEANFIGKGSITVNTHKQEDNTVEKEVKTLEYTPRTSDSKTKSLESKNKVISSNESKNDEWESF